ncbi:MAG: acetylornithine transaminase [Deltaproteobacteria bacterium]|nr:acetylornithine transaminase [Deltaproteobacteria bacterium]
MGTTELLALAQQRLLATYRPQPFVVARGRGSELFDVDGARYLDFCAGVAVCCLGHGHPVLERAIAEQATRVIQTSNYFYNEENILLADELCRATGFDRAFFCNSGAEANEAVLKLARRHFHLKGQVERIRLICFERAFHGRTMATVTMGGTEAYRVGFGPPLAGVDHVPYGDLDAVRRAMGPEVAAIHVEPVQGEGGVLPAPPGFLEGLRQLCDEHGALLTMDEVQTGIGRTGRMLAAEHSGVRADAVALAKGLGGGFPIGAMLVRDHLAESLPTGTHGSTFGGNPLASAVGRTVLRVLAEEGLLERAKVGGERLGAGLAAVAARHPKLCRGERGLGLLRALVLNDGTVARDFLGPAREHGLLVTAAGASALRFTPPLVVTDAEIDEAVERLDTMLSAHEAAASAG